MAIKALTLASTKNVELSTDPDRGTPEATVFKIGTLDSRVIGYLRDSAATIQYDEGDRSRVSTKVNNSAVEFETVQFGLRGITNFKDDKGNDVPFKTVRKNIGSSTYAVVAPETVALLSIFDIRELAYEITRINSVEEDEAKN